MMAGLYRLSNPQEWIDLYGDYLFRYALLRVRHPHIAEDLLQDTFLSALQARSSFAGRSPEQFWLVGILKHKLMDYYRKAKTEAPGEGDADTRENWNDAFDDHGHWKTGETGPKEWTMDPGTILERKEFWEALTRCLGELPTRQAHAFSLRTIEGHSSNDVCETLEISHSNLWVILYRVRMHLRRCLESNWQGR